MNIVDFDVEEEEETEENNDQLAMFLKGLESQPML